MERFPPDAIIGGTAKAGTTSLFSILQQHPQIAVSAIKEPRFFAHCDEPLEHWSVSADPRDVVVRDPHAYRALFAKSQPGSLRLEASPVYLYSRSAAQALAQRSPHCKCIFILRNPIARAFSHFQHMQRDQRETARTFREALQLEDQRIRGNYDFSFHYVSMGAYATQLRRFAATFPRNQLCIIDYDRFNRRPDSVIGEILAFLELPPAEVNCKIRRNVSKTTQQSTAGRLVTSRHPIKRAIGRMLGDSTRSRLKNWLLRTPGPSKQDVAFIESRLLDEILTLDKMVDWNARAWLRDGAAESSRRSNS